MAIHVINPNATPEPAATVNYQAPQFEYGPAVLDTVSKEAVETLAKIDLVEVQEEDVTKHPKFIKFVKSLPEKV